MLLLPGGGANAYETDQFSNRDTDIADSTDVLNRQMNRTIEEIVEEWDRGHDEWAFVNQIYRKVGGRHWVDRIERWAMRSPDVEKMDTPRYGSIYAKHPIWATRTIALFGIGKTIRLNRQLIGTDKLGHFISQGRKFYRRFRRLGSEDEAALRSAFTEKAIFGVMTTGNYSNADLVANYEGHRFYRSLFENDIIEGKPAILRWEDDGWVIQREFDWADHVNEYWDEARVCAGPGARRPVLDRQRRKPEAALRAPRVERQFRAQARLTLPGAGVSRNRRYCDRKIVAGCSSISLMR